MRTNDFKELFVERQKSFFSSIVSLCQNQKLYWQAYSCELEFNDEGFVSMIPKPDNRLPSSDDINELIKYCHFLTGQGFKLELVITWSKELLKIALVAWEEEDEPEWPEDIRQDFVYRWNGVK